MHVDIPDAIQNLNAFWSIAIGAVLATGGGFAATQFELHLEQRRRERNGAMFFGELVQTIAILVDYAKEARGIGDPYGPITLRMLRSIRREIDIYDRNRESLYDLRDAGLRTKIHGLTIRLAMALEGVFDATREMDEALAALKKPNLSNSIIDELQGRIENLAAVRNSAFDYVVQNAAELRPVVKSLEPHARQSIERLADVVREDD